MASSQIELQRFEDVHQTSGVWQDQSRTALDAEAELESPTTSAPHEFSLPPVDGGKDAWLFLAASFVIEALVWGMPYQIYFLSFIIIRGDTIVLLYCVPCVLVKNSRTLTIEIGCADPQR
jgi:hypothetical protein